ncbi:hypothetical protein Pyrde_1393 [Pyrodictium delaneyi]|uniref:Uncharacterized protein n=1 Tax=Pyrodictium delaneyi TaxID=1273541 RepID=A0A0P0N598_9CREN|nr:hypothetical protein [Pyrodictium delaneyi]ALL01439.1 hypothetical protein Pyrde_1393 [Pyrodictium delaneyi]OWJ54645.1 hypothetical protein Pdsh_06395 [Pyrodictium delaneyi]
MAKPPGAYLLARAERDSELLLLEAQACPAPEPRAYSPPYTVEAAPYTLTASRNPQLGRLAPTVLLAPVLQEEKDYTWIIVEYEDPGPPA